jgi:hypothetical protein
MIARVQPWGDRWLVVIGAASIILGNFENKQEAEEYAAACSGC